MTKKKIVKSGTRADGVLSPEELQKAIADYKKRRAERLEGQKDDDMAPPADDTTDTKKTAEADGDDDDTTAEGPDNQKAAVQAIKDRRDRRDEDGDPKDKDAAMGVIAQQDSDMDILFDIIDTLLAERDMKAQADGDNCDPNDPNANCNTDDDDTDDADNKPAGALKAVNGDDDDEDDDLNEDEDDDDIPTTNEADVGDSSVKEPTSNMDSIDAIVRQRVQLGVAGAKLGIKGLENMKLSAAKKTVIRAVNPNIRLDGKSDAYINGAFACAMDAVNAGSRKGTNYQKKQMFNGDSRGFRAKTSVSSSDVARARMIERRINKEAK